MKAMTTRQTHIWKTYISTDDNIYLSPLFRIIYVYKPSDSLLLVSLKYSLYCGFMHITDEILQSSMNPQLWSVFTKTLKESW